MKRDWSRRVLSFIAIGIGLLIFFSAHGTAEVMGGVPTVRIPLIQGGIHVDGRLGDVRWGKARRLTLRDNASGGQAGQAAHVRLLWDREFLYVAFECRDTDVSATLNLRDDNLWMEEAVEVFLDPAGEGKEYLEIEVNPLGTIYDAWISYSPNIDFEKAKIFDFKNLSAAAGMMSGAEGWICEMAIPLGELPAKITKKARINLTRIDRLNGRHVYDAWSPTGRWFHVPEKFGKAVFGGLGR